MKLRIFFILFCLFCLLITIQMDQKEINTPPLSSPAPKPIPEKTITISWWGDDETHEKNLAVIKWFEQVYPEIDVQCMYGSLENWKDYVDYAIKSNSLTDICLIQEAWLDHMSNAFLDVNQFESFSPTNISKQILWKHKKEVSPKFIPIYNSTLPNVPFFLPSKVPSSGYAISKTAEHPDECALLINFLINIK